ncbi:MAG: DNA primase [Zetaproteobacteria bacterium CG12_big_fil_rev_8_21_14_0_65_55_1124]|nr:MAG: DNA primase [Zetaproteobacteria bacterium CG1_02_55_237]PIS20468.1 MAG: DNA primase [Zetaproteobacteria bacterium CG08_land_8_20_14_0_20_55_17]PIW43746.1 MAG: DNA primase [Zetaproteobacteria bacterium CG12_big_fil_rev_8_21_14_0_65_55_1124]PIY53282.1 MAG: DNA primase [Zetaproteobacteria bacterium CG_4_10_14_0_8_um_filter_55_43]PIZ40145.1 MAG: DNA primase [Zetaproteobacteria bacterium CG_4_10_14_0_2_um_filter_55_20]PJB82150.1 MAG: DNA primase [Zetaproteobacteria bacterium CG_4_9_14_0_8_u
MAHFPTEFLDEVLARTDIVELIARHVQLKKSGNNFMGLCPFHHEKSPSFSVSADKQLFYCFGCGKGGGAFQFLTEHDGYSFPEAVEYLAEKAGLEVPQSLAPDSGDQEKRKRALALLEQGATLFARALMSQEGKAGLDYFHRRKLSQDIISKYRLGYALPGYGFLEKVLGRDARMQAQLEAVGLMFKGDRGYVDRFRARVMFPITDRRGQVVGFGGRILDQGEPKYLNSPETAYFHKSDLLYGFSEHRDEIRSRKLLVVVEGYMDVLAMAAHGLPVGLAPLGTAIGERQVREILRLHAEPVFCFDGDRAGKQASWRALERMLPVLSSDYGPRFLYLPEGEDPDSILQREGADAFVQRLEIEAKPVLDTWIQGLKNLAGSGVEGRARMAKKADAMLAVMQDDYLRQVWRQEAEKVTTLKLKAPEASPRKPHPISRVASLATPNQEKFLAALLQKPERIRPLLLDQNVFFLDDDGLNLVYTRVLELAATNTGVVQALLLEFPQEERIPLWASQSDISDEEYEKLELLMRERHLHRLCKKPGTLEEKTYRQEQWKKISEKLKKVGH